MSEPTVQVAEMPVEISETRREKKHLAYTLCKRIFDFVCSLIASVFLLIPIGVIAVVIMLKDPGNPFYVHTRVGQGGKPIKVMKFRTMRKGADKLEDMLTTEQLEEYRREYKIRDDPRLIGWKKPGDGDKCFGAKLRRASLDEIMQIPYNILLKGNMSFVGPRPIIESELQSYYRPEQQKRLLSVKPGITGLWQVMGRNNCTYESGERQKVELQYVEEKGIWTDVKILFRTFGTILRPGGGILTRRCIPSKRGKTCRKLLFGLKQALLLPVTLVVGAVGVQEGVYEGQEETEESVKPATGDRLGYRFVKRTFDLLVAIVCLTVGLPIYLLIAFAIVIDDPGNPLFVQRRVGKDGKEFNMVKFRTMYKDADAAKSELLIHNRHIGVHFKMDNDPRVTRVGRFLRRTSLDEIPQAVNILLGTMTVVGPRPFIPSEQSQLPSDRLCVKPGLSCYWQLVDSTGMTDEEQLELDYKYIRECGIWTDLKIIFQTVRIMFVGRNG